MPDIKAKFGTAGQVITCTVASLANNSARQSTEIVNSNRALDALVTFKLKSGSSGVTSSGSVNFFVFGTTDNGTTRTENAGATDAAITLVSPTNLRPLGVMSMVATATTYVAGPFSVATAFGGVLPARWGIVVENVSGGAFDSSGASHLITYQEVFGEIL